MHCCIDYLIIVSDVIYCLRVIDDLLQLLAGSFIEFHLVSDVNQSQFIIFIDTFLHARIRRPKLHRYWQRSIRLRSRLTNASAGSSDSCFADGKLARL
jgi:hypothetical protein